MRTRWKRLLASLLTLVMLATVLPTQALAAAAALAGNSLEENQAILAQLEELCGSQEEAQGYYALLQEYGLLDQEGNLPDQWEITLDGEPVTLEDLRAILAGDYDPARTVTVDGTPLTLEELDTMLQIEDYIAHLRKTYFSGGKWTQESLTALRSLQAQVKSEGIEMVGLSDDVEGPSGVNHGAVLTVSEPTINGNQYTFTVSTSKAQKAPITFQYAAYSGSLGASGSGNGTIAAGAASTTFTVTAGSANGRINGQGTFVVSVFNVQNAQFENGVTAWSRKINISETTAFKYAGKDEKNLFYSGGYYLSSGWNWYDDEDVWVGESKGLRDGENSIVDRWNHNGVADGDPWDQDYLIEYLKKTSDTLSVPGLSAGKYSKVLTVEPTFKGFDPGEFVVPCATSEDALENGTKTYREFWPFFSWLGNWPEPEFVIKQTGEYEAAYRVLIDGGIVQKERDKRIEKFSPGYLERKPGKSEFYSGQTFNLSENSDISHEVEIIQSFYQHETETFDYDGTGNFGNSIFVIDPELSANITLTLQEITDATDVTFSAPQGTYYPGQMVPITAKFGFPMEIDTTMSITVDREKLYPVEKNTTADVCTFLYPVTNEKSGSKIVVTSVDLSKTGANGKAMKVMPTNMNKELPNVDLNTPDKKAAITSFTIKEIENVLTNPVMVVEAKLSDNEAVTKWLDEDFQRNDDGTSISKSLSASVNGGAEKIQFQLSGETITGATLTARIPLALNVSGADQTHVAELYLDDQVVVGRADTVTQQPAVFIKDGDLTLSLSVKDKEGNAYPDADKIIYPQDEPKITAGYTLSEDKTFSFTTSDQFAWTSSDEGVAQIDQDGKITPTGKAGKVFFTLTALNGNVEGKAVTKTTETLNFGAGLTPFLLIPNKDITSVAGNEVTVYWSTNLADKNTGETTYTISLTRGTEKTEFDPVISPKGSPISSFVIPADKLTYDYEKPNNNTLTVRISSEYGGQTLTATATITLTSQPAQVTLNDLESYYITDKNGSVNIGWTIKNFDQATSADQNEIFKFEIRRNDAQIDTGVSVKPGGGDVIGNYTLKIPDIKATPETPTSYRDVYTVTVQAKNGTDSTWSYDSFLLYVYDAEALQIMVDGTAKDSLTMSNQDKFAKNGDKTVNTADWQKWVLEMKRDINLKNVISANYGQYAWTELSDQIQWASSDSATASLNYQQGTLYENIENFSYTSYRPTTDFVLSGLQDGTATLTAKHKLAGMSDQVDVTVETMKDKLYLFQCYPQQTTTLTFAVYTDAKKTQTKQVRATSDEKGAAAYYAEYGIASDVYCESTGKDGNTYLGTFYRDRLETGEKDSTKLALYPCNNLNLRRAAYAYLYLKKPDGTPYTGDITFRGGIYVNGEYKKEGLFQLNGSTTRAVDVEGYEDTTVKPDENGKLEVVMDQTQWGLPNDQVSAGDKVSYVFQIEQGSGGTDYYPLLVTIDAQANADAFVGSGEAVVTFRANDSEEKQPFIASQAGSYSNSGTLTGLLNATGNVGPSDSCPEAILTTAVMWWGDEKPGDPAAAKNSLQLVTETNRTVAGGNGQFTVENTAYPFSDMLITQYSVKLNQQTMKDLLNPGKSTGLALNYYRDGQTLSRREALPFRLCNMLGMGKIEEEKELTTMLQQMGGFANADAKTAGNSGIDQGDQFVQVLLNLVAGEEYVTGKDKLFSIQLIPTADPTKFLGFIEANIGNMSDKDQVTGLYAKPNEELDLDYTPGLAEVMMLAGMKTPFQYAMGQMNDFFKATKSKNVRNIHFDLGGYAESMIYYDSAAGKWKIQILNGGFNAGGGASFSWNVNTWCGPIPFTATLTAGGAAEVSMDALSVAYGNKTTGEQGIGNDFLTQLRLYLYLRFFAGVGFDYSIVAFKLGVFGQVNLDMNFRWLNRPYMDGGKNKEIIYNVADGTHNTDYGGEYNLNGQSFKIDGQVGLEFLMKLLFISYEQILYSYQFNLLDEKTGQWETIQNNWAANQSANDAAIGGLVKNGSLSVMNAGGQQMLALNLAPTLESRDYLDEGGRRWGEGFSFFSLDKENGLENLETNTYPYANPMVSDDGKIVAYLTDQGDTDVNKTRAAFATKSGNSYQKAGIIHDEGSEAGFGDSQLSLSGTEKFAAAAWTRQMVEIQKDKQEDEKTVLTDEDQMMMLNGTDVFASVYVDKKWTTTRLSTNSSPDLAPVVATSGEKAIVAWRSVSSSGPKVDTDGEKDLMNPTDFDQKDTIVYKTYDGTKWSEETKTLYNGTSGAVKAIVAEMLTDGTAAVSYTLDKDQEDKTTTDREIVYAVLDNKNYEVTRNVQATTDSYLDENPQLAAVKFPGDTGDQEQFVLGWYSEEAVSTDAPAVLDGGEAQTTEPVSDIRLLSFGPDGVTNQRLPDSLSQVADGYDVAITSNFRFTKNADSINDLSILWAERVTGETEELANGEGSGTVVTTPESMPASIEKDVLKGIKFYTYGEKNELVRFTGAVTVAEMETPGTLIDHFDAYVSNATTNEIKSVILATTYGENGQTQTRTAQTVGGDTVQFEVPAATSNLYTATETYADKIDVPAVVPDYASVRLGATTQLQFNIDNNGIHAINALEIDVGGTKTEYEALNLLPGESIQLYADYNVPTEGVEDPKYTVTATFDDSTGAAGEAKTTVNGQPGNVKTGTVYLDLPDVEITEAKIVKEEAGKRTIQFKLNNAADAALAASGRSVKVGFYTDVTCEKPIEGLTPITIAEAEELKMVDEGGYSKQVAFDVAEFVKESYTGKDKGKKPQEIPETGVTVYLKAEVLDKVTKSGEEPKVQGEPVASNNYASVTCENLKTRTGKDVSLNSDFAVDKNGNTTVTVQLQNNLLTQKSSGNLIVTLLDKTGKVLAQQQSYTGKNPDNGLIELDGEKHEEQVFTFTGMTGYDVRVSYSDAKLDKTDNVNLKTVETDGAALTYDETTKTYSGSTGQLSATLATIVPEDLRAAVTVDGQPYTQSMRLPLYRGENKFTIVVTSQDKSITETYTLLLHSDLPSGGTSYQIVPPAETENGTVTVSPSRAKQGSTVTITATPDEGYRLDTLTATDKNGKEISLTDKGDGKFTFRMPASKVTISASFVEATEVPEGSFDDVFPEDYYYDAVQWAAEKGIANGMSPTSFSPKAHCTRAQMVTFLWRAAGSPEAGRQGNPFTDVSAESYYYNAVLWAAEQGIALGTDVDKFSPEATVTRAQTVTFLHRAAGSPEAEGENPFVDVPAGAYYLAAVQWAAEKGVALGTGPDTFSPNDNCTRGQIVTFLYRAAQ